MKKILFIIGMLTSFVLYGQIDTIQNGDSGLSTRNKLNRVIDTLNNHTATKDELSDSAQYLQSQIDTVVTPSELDSTFQSAKDYADALSITLPTNTPRDSIPIYDSIAALRGDIGSGGYTLPSTVPIDSARIYDSLAALPTFADVIDTTGTHPYDTLNADVLILDEDTIIGSDNTIEVTWEAVIDSLLDNGLSIASNKSDAIDTTENHEFESLTSDTTKTDVIQGKESDTLYIIDNVSYSSGISGTVDTMSFSVSLSADYKGVYPTRQVTLTNTTTITIDNIPYGLAADLYVIQGGSGSYGVTISGATEAVSSSGALEAAVGSITLYQFINIGGVYYYWISSVKE